MELLSHLIVSRLRGAGLADSRLTSPQDLWALLREVPLPLSFAERPLALNYVFCLPVCSLKKKKNHW